MKFSKIKCDCCGRRHDLRLTSVGFCARCEDATTATTANWSAEPFLATIQSDGSRASYKSYLGRVCRMLGIPSLVEADFSAITESAAAAVIAAANLSKSLSSSMRSAVRAVRAFCEATVGTPKPCGYIRAAKVVVEEAGKLVVNGSNLHFPTDREIRAQAMPKVTLDPTTFDNFETGIYAAA